jgi:hypothetical protein
MPASSAFVASDKVARSGYYPLSLSVRRRSTIRLPRWTADDLPIVPKTVELEQRLSRLEGSYGDMHEQLDTLTRRVIALQAQLDYLIARLNL